MLIPLLVVIKRYEGHRFNHGDNPLLHNQTNRDPNRDKILAESNHPRTAEIYCQFPRQGDIFGYSTNYSL